MSICLFYILPGVFPLVHRHSDIPVTKHDGKGGREADKGRESDRGERGGGKGGREEGRKNRKEGDSPRQSAYKDTHIRTHTEGNSYKEQKGGRQSSAVSI